MHYLTHLSITLGTITPRSINILSYFWRNLFLLQKIGVFRLRFSKCFRSCTSGLCLLWNVRDAERRQKIDTMKLHARWELKRIQI